MKNVQTIHIEGLWFHRGLTNTERVEIYNQTPLL